METIYNNGEVAVFLKHHNLNDLSGKNSVSCELTIAIVWNDDETFKVWDQTDPQALNWEEIYTVEELNDMTEGFGGPSPLPAPIWRNPLSESQFPTELAKLHKVARGMGLLLPEAPRLMKSFDIQREDGTVARRWVSLRKNHFSWNDPHPYAKAARSLVPESIVVYCNMLLALWR